MKFLALLLAFPALAFSKTINLPSQTLLFVPEKGEVKSAAVISRCLRSATTWEVFNNGGKGYMACKNYVVNGVTSDKYEDSVRIELKKIGPNQFALDPSVISFSTSRKGHLCIGVYAQLTGAEYTNNNDNYSLVNFCTVEKLPFNTNSYVYNNNRQGSLQKFNDYLAAPIVLKTK